MLSRDYRDMTAGAALMLGGAAVVIYAMLNLELGTLRQMGPGMFPFGLGWIMAGLGLILLLQSFFRTGVMPEIRIYVPVVVVASVIAFGLLVRPFGLIPAVIAATVISTLAERRFRPLSTVVLSAALCLISWLVFKVALGLPVFMLRWPF